MVSCDPVDVDVLLARAEERITNAELTLAQLTGRTADLEWQIAAVVEMLKPKPFQLTTLEELEKTHTLAVLAEVNGNKAQAARILGVSLRTLYRNFHRWDLTAGVDTASP